MVKRLSGWLVVLALAACGDNSRVCGPNTVDMDGVCSGTGGGICGDGTVLNPDTDQCEPDGSQCPPGTVLVGGHCVDGGNVTVDLEEGPEPNGFEIGAIPAGLVTLKPAGMSFTIHGCIKPTDNITPDLDVYVMTVTAPTLVKITSDGVAGLAAGFVALGDPADPAIASYQRFGLNIATDTSKRELYLPAAGTYALVMSDTRSLLPLVDGGSTFPPAGNPDGTSCYFTSIEQRPIATTNLDLATGDTGTIGEDLKFYTGTFPQGFTSVTASIASPNAAASLIVANNGALRQIDDGTPDANALFGGIKPGDMPLIVLDYVFDYALFPVSYKIGVDFALGSQALSTTGAAVSVTSKGQSFGGDFGAINLVHWDVGEAAHTDGVDLRVVDAGGTNPFQVAGVMVDQDGFIVGQFTGLGGNAASSTTFDHYTGLLREATPGRYYFVLFAPRNPVGTAFKIKSSFTPLAADVVQLDTPTAPIAINAFNSNPVVFNAGAEPWVVLDGKGTNTGNITASYYALATPGRFDSLAVRSGPNPGAPSTLASEPAPELAFVFPTGGNPKGRILENETAATPAAVTDFFVKVNPAVTSGANRTFTLDATTRAYHNFATLAAGTTTQVANEPIDPTTPLRRYFVETAPGNIVTLTVAPNSATFDPVIATLHVDESDDRVVNANPAARAETLRFAQNASGFTAFVVRNAGPVTALNRFTLTVKIEPPFYSVSNTATAFADACAGGVPRPIVQGDTDEGFTGTVGMINGMTFYGKGAGSFKISTNGFITFNTAATDPSFSPAALPDGVGDANIAPAWDDLTNVAICTKVVNGKLVVQWTGEEFAFIGTGAHVQFQAILDPASDSVEFVYGPDQAATGENAVSGVQSRAGDEATQIGAFSAFIAPATSKKLTHP